MTAVLHPPLVATRGRYAPFIVYGTLAVGAMLVGVAGLADPRQEFLAVTILLCVYLALEILRVRSEEPTRWLMNPAVLASLATFYLQFGLTNLIYLDSQNRELIRAAELMRGEDIFVWLTKASWYTLSGAVAMWIGFRSGLGTRLSRFVWDGLRLDRVLRAGEGIRWPAVVLCIAIAGFARLLQIKLGVFGYASDMTQLVEGAKYRTILGLTTDISAFTLLLVAMEYFRNPTRRVGLVLLTLTSYEVAVGFLAGFKGQVVMPVVVVGIASLAMRGKVPIRYMVLAVLLFLPAYLVIEPFRRLRQLDAEFNSVSLSYMVTSLVAARNAVDPGLQADVAKRVPLDVVARMNLTSQAAVVMWYKTRFRLPPDTPPFLSKLFLAPAHAYVPRVLWNSKPLENVGGWYSQTVWMNPNENQAEGISPVGYLYFAGGWLAVVLGFAAIGVFQKLFWTMLAHRGAPGLVVYCGLLSVLVLIDSSVNGLFVNYFRLFPALLVLQRLVYRR